MQNQQEVAVANLSSQIVSTELSSSDLIKQTEITKISQTLGSSQEGKPEQTNEIKVNELRPNNQNEANSPIKNDQIVQKCATLNKTSAPVYKYCVFAGNYPQYIRDALALRGNWQEVQPSIEAVSEVDLLWKPFNVNRQGFELMDKRQRDHTNYAKKPLVYNHFEHISVLSTKTGLLKTLKEYYALNKEAKEANYTVEDTLPTAYLINSNSNDAEFQQFKMKFAQIERGFSYSEKMPCKQYTQNFWLLKPANMNQGRGIEIFSNMKQVQSFLNFKQSDQQWIAQKYVEKPLLYKNRKFDIRVLALGTHENDLFFYDTGYLRTSSDQYSMDNKNKFVHLTNNCYQKSSTNYEKFEEGNQLTYGQFQDYLDETFPTLGVKFTDTLTRIKDIIIDCYLAGISRNQMNSNNREPCFELMGFDFLIDEDFRVWLIEVNTNPYFGVLNTGLPNFIDNLVDDTFKLTLDRVLNRQEKDESGRPSGYELLYSQKQKINKRRAYNEGIYPVASTKQEIHKERQKVREKAGTSTIANNNNQTIIDKTLTKNNNQSYKASQTGLGPYKNPVVIAAPIISQKSSQLKNSNNKNKNTNNKKQMYGTIESQMRSRSVVTRSLTPDNATKNNQQETKLNSKDTKSRNDNLVEIGDQQTTGHNSSRLPNITDHHSVKRQRSILGLATSIIEKRIIDGNQISPIVLSGEKSGAEAGLGASGQKNVASCKMAAQQYQLQHSTAGGAKNYQSNNSLTIVMRKQAEDNRQVQQMQQQEYLQRVQKLLKVKNILDQTKEALCIPEGYENKKKEFSRLFSQLCTIITNIDQQTKKDVQLALQAFKMLVFSQFIIHFNDKNVLNKILSLFKVEAPQSSDLKSTLLKFLIEITKHFVIRQTFLGKKTFSKFAKILLKNLASNSTASQNRNEQNNDVEVMATSNRDSSRQPQTTVNNQQKQQSKFTTQLIQLFVQTCSMGTSKVYIPGETKELEAIRKKAIMNGCVVIADLIKQANLEDTKLVRKVNNEVTEALDPVDSRIHIYALYQHFKSKLNKQPQASMPQDQQTDTNNTISQVAIDKANDETLPIIKQTENQVQLIQAIEKVEVNKTFQKIKYIIESQMTLAQLQIQQNSKFPACLDSASYQSLFNIGYLLNWLSKVEYTSQVGVTKNGDELGAIQTASTINLKAQSNTRDIHPTTSIHSNAKTIARRRQTQDQQQTQQTSTHFSNKKHFKNSANSANKTFQCLPQGNNKNEDGQQASHKLSNSQLDHEIVQIRESSEIIGKIAKSRVNRLAGGSGNTHIMSMSNENLLAHKEVLSSGQDFQIQQRPSVVENSFKSSKGSIYQLRNHNNMGSSNGKYKKIQKQLSGAGISENDYKDTKEQLVLPLLQSQNNLAINNTKQTIRAQFRPNILLHNSSYYSNKLQPYLESNNVSSNLKGGTNKKLSDSVYNNNNSNGLASGHGIGSGSGSIGGGMGVAYLQNNTSSKRNLSEITPPNYKVFNKNKQNSQGSYMNRQPKKKIIENGTKLHLASQKSIIIHNEGEQDKSQYFNKPTFSDHEQTKLSKAVAPNSDAASVISPMQEAV